MCSIKHGVPNTLSTQPRLVTEGYATLLWMPHRATSIKELGRIPALLQNRSNRHFGTLWRLVVLFKLIAHLLECYPFHTLMFVDMLDDPVV